MRHMFAVDGRVAVSRLALSALLASASGLARAEGGDVQGQISESAQIIALAGDGANPEISGAPAVAPAAPPPPANPYAKFAPYAMKGWTIYIPDPSNFLDRGTYDLRSSMADNGLYVFGFSNTTFTYDLRNGNQLYGTTQVYSGEKPTVTSNNFVYLTYDLGKLGLKGGQFGAGMTYEYVNWDPAGPTYWHISDIKYYQPLLNGQAELTIGYVGNSAVYNGVYVGGNLAGGTFGVNANIPQEVGQANSLITRPGVNLKVYLGGGFYSLSGIQRSWAPGGTSAEIHNNGFGFGWSGPGVGELFQQEVGFQRVAQPGRPSTWLRAGYAFNNSSYASLKKPGTTENNHYWSVLGDRQILQLGDTAATAYRGLYAGFSVMEAPPQVDRFSQYFEVRLYMKAPLASRPKDSLSLVLNQNRFSKYAIANAQAAGLKTDDEATTASLGYTANVFHGIFITSGLSFIDHPRAVTTVPQQRPALNALINAIIYF